MKKLTTLALVVMAIAFAAYAGPYFVAEQNPLVADAMVLAGYDFDEPIAMGQFSIHGDGFGIIDNLWAYPWDIAGGFTLGFNIAESIDEGYGRDVFGVDLDMSYLLLPIAVVESLQVTINGYPSLHTTVYASVSFWPFEPLVGVECRW